MASLKDNALTKALSQIWFCGDVHDEFKWIVRALQNPANAKALPQWIVLLGDQDLIDRSLKEALGPVWDASDGARVAFIHGNHDCDTEQRWAALMDHGAAVSLDGRVVDMGGVLVAGLGGIFRSRVWYPQEGDEKPTITSRKEASRMRIAGAKFQGCIYPDEYQALAHRRANILVTHEAPSCHPHGFMAIDRLARSLRVRAAFHGHHHDDRTDKYRRHWPAMRFDAYAVPFRGIKNGLGEVIFEGEVR
jgi:calcineurin-like phosphoesterase family protein